MNKNLIKGESLLLLTAVIWGSCFLFMKRGMDYIGPFTLGAFRFLLGAAALLPVVYFTRNKQKSTQQDRKTLWKAGLFCGVILFLGASLQQIGLVYTSSGKAAFITEMEIVVVALLCAVITKKVHLLITVGVLIAVTGLYLLCVQGAFSLNIGDLYELFGALFWGIQVLLIDHYAKRCNVIWLALLQFLVAGVLSLGGMLWEHPQLAAVLACKIPILYTAFIEVALCYTLQLMGQRYVPPVVSSVTMALQAVFAALFGFLFLHEILSPKELAGCTLMLLAISIVQLPLLRKQVSKP